MPYDIIKSCYDHKYVRMPRKWKKKRGEKKEEKKIMKKKMKKMKNCQLEPPIKHVSN